MNATSVSRIAKYALLASCASSVLILPSPSRAQTTNGQSAAAQASDTSAAIEEVVVTGSRIRQTQADLPTPLTTLTPQAIEDNGYVQIGQALNTDPSMNPSTAISGNHGPSSGNVGQYPALYGLGQGRTLTLLNGERLPSTAIPVIGGAQSNGAGATVANGGVNGDPGFDANLMPVGLIERVDVVPAGGAAVYGSDAIAGVVNYVLKDHFNGVQFDYQQSLTTFGDYPTESVRFTAGTDFLNHKGNVAIDVEWSKNPPISEEQRPYTALLPYTAAVPGSNPPAFIVDPDYRFWEIDPNGVLFKTATAAAANLLGLKFGPGGGVVPQNYGTIVGVPFESGGDGFQERDFTSLLEGEQRQTFFATSHYDVAEHLKVSAELMYARTDANDPYATSEPGNSVSNGAYSVSINPTTGAVTIPHPYGALAITNTNPFLTQSAIAGITAAYPAFATGSPVYESIEPWRDLMTTQQAIYDTQVYRGRLALDGDFDTLNRNFYWSLSFSHSVVQGDYLTPAVNIYNFAEAITPAVNSAGQIVCAVNNPTVTVAACAPINPFTPGGVSRAAQQFVTTTGGETDRSTQEDLVGNLGGSIYTLPAGDLKFSVGYEHRAATSQFDPSQAWQLGLINAGSINPYQSGEYHTNEYSAELEAPILGKNFSIPFVEALALNGAFRHVDNSLTNSEDVWDAGMRWQIIPDITLRGSLSRNFRAPDLAEVFKPASTAPGTVIDPCDFREIALGTSPSTRAANCLALFQANPTFGLNSVTNLPAGSSAAARLANFQDPSVNFSTVAVTSSGNLNLQNEISHTKTFGIVLQPRFIDGLTFTADRIMIHLVNALSSFTGANFQQACFDTSPQPAAICNNFVTRDAVTGNIATSTSTYYNAGYQNFHGEVYHLDYSFGLSSLFGGTHDIGKVGVSVDATHTTLADLSVTGFDLSVNNNTIAQPNWAGRLNLTYTYDNWRFAYQGVYRGPALLAAGDNPSNAPYPYVHANTTSNLSAIYTVMEHFQARLGVNNVFNQMPSFPSFYGDIIGRTVFAGLRVTY